MKIKFFTLILLVAISLLGCSFQTNKSKTENNTVNSEIDINVSDDDFFDTEMTSKPTNADMKLIKKGMSFNSVVEKIGRPHGIADGVSISSYFKWTTVEGTTYVVLFYSPEKLENTDQMTLSEYYSHTIAAFDPRS